MEFRTDLPDKKQMGRLRRSKAPMLLAKCPTQGSFLFLNQTSSSKGVVAAHEFYKKEGLIIREVAPTESKTVIRQYIRDWCEANGHAIVYRKQIATAMFNDGMRRAVMPSESQMAKLRESDSLMALLLKLTGGWEFKQAFFKNGKECPFWSSADFSTAILAGCFAPDAEEADIYDAIIANYKEQGLELSPLSEKRQSSIR